MGGDRIEAKELIRCLNRFIRQDDDNRRTDGDDSFDSQQPCGQAEASRWADEIGPGVADAGHYGFAHRNPLNLYGSNPLTHPRISASRPSTVATANGPPGFGLP